MYGGYDGSATQFEPEPVYHEPEPVYHTPTMAGGGSNGADGSVVATYTINLSTEDGSSSGTCDVKLMATWPPSVAIRCQAGGVATGQPLLPLTEVVSPTAWRHVLSEGNVQIKCREHGMDTLWLIGTDVPAPPATVAAGLRQLLRGCMRMRRTRRERWVRQAFGARHSRGGWRGLRRRGLRRRGGVLVFGGATASRRRRKICCGGARGC